MNLKRWILYGSVAALALGAMAFTACGGDDDDDGGSSSSSGGTGSDEKFVADICKAGATFFAKLEKLAPEIATKSEAEQAKAAAPAMEDFANAFAKANPPKDLKEWHDETAKTMKDAVAELKAGKTDGTFFSGDSPFSDPPEEAQARLSKIADGNKDCQDASFGFGE
jgi:hypothetical protein